MSREIGPAERKARRRTWVGTSSVVAGLVVLGAAPVPGTAGLLPGDDGGAGGSPSLSTALRQTVGEVRDTVKVTVDRVMAHAPATPKPAGDAAAPAPTPRAAATDPQTQPPLHGTNPHGQGDVAVIDLTPSNTRPTSGDPTGKDSGEDVVVGRARGEQTSSGTFHGHLTIAALFGNEILGVNTNPGESRAGPLDALQQGLLDPICNGSANQVCVSAVRADSATTSSGSTNKFSIAHATLGGANGLDVGAAESNGNINQDAQCQTTHGDSSVANVTAAGQAVAALAQSTSDSKACKGRTPTQTNTSKVLGLGGTAVPFPAAGCGTGAPDTQTGIPTLLPIVCNADDSNSQAAVPNGVRQALSVFVLATGTTGAANVRAGGSESAAVAPAAQCADGIDNDGDGLIDAADGGCHSDGNPNNSGSYNAADDDESGGDSGTTGSGDTSNGSNGDGSSTTGSGDATGNGTNATQCADGADNDGDGRVDSADPGCHSDGNAANPASYVPSDDSEADNANTSKASSLPFTGTNVLGTAIAGLLIIASGLALRRRLEDA